MYLKYPRLDYFRIFQLEISWFPRVYYDISRLADEFVKLDKILNG